MRRIHIVWALLFAAAVLAGAAAAVAGRGETAHTTASGWRNRHRLAPPRRL